MQQRGCCPRLVTEVEVPLFISRVFEQMLVVTETFQLFKLVCYGASPELGHVSADEALWSS